MSEEKYNPFGQATIDGCSERLATQLHAVERICESDQERWLLQRRIVLGVDRYWTRMSFVWSAFMVWVLGGSMERGFQWWLHRLFDSYWLMVIGCFVVGAILSGLSGIVIADRKAYGDTRQVKFGKAMLVGSLCLMGFPFLPLLVLLFAVAVPKLLERRKRFDLKRLTNDLPSGREDVRFREYSLLLDCMQMWTGWTEYLNQQTKKLELGLIPDARRGELERAIKTLREDETFIMKQVQYCEHLAAQGEFGTLTGPASDADRVHELSDRMDDLVRHVQELQEIDEKAIAALEVSRLKSK